MSYHDHAARRQTVRRGRERGCWLYVTARALERTGIDPNGPPPLYRTWSGTNNGLLVRFYAPEQSSTSSLDAPADVV